MTDLRAVSHACAGWPITAPERTDRLPPRPTRIPQRASGMCDGEDDAHHEARHIFHDFANLPEALRWAASFPCDAPSCTGVHLVVWADSWVPAWTETWQRKWKPRWRVRIVSANQQADLG